MSVSYFPVSHIVGMSSQLWQLQRKIRSLCLLLVFDGLYFNCTKRIFKFWRNQSSSGWIYQFSTGHVLFHVLHKVWEGLWRSQVSPLQFKRWRTNSGFATSLTFFQGYKVSWRTLDFQEEQRYAEDNGKVEWEDWGVYDCGRQVGLICRARRLGLIDHCAIRNPVIDAESCSKAGDWKHCDYDIRYYILNQRGSRDYWNSQILVGLTWIFWF